MDLNAGSPYEVRLSEALLEIDQRARALARRAASIAKLANEPGMGGLQKRAEDAQRHLEDVSHSLEPLRAKPGKLVLHADERVAVRAESDAVRCALEITGELALGVDTEPDLSGASFGGKTGSIHARELLGFVRAQKLSGVLVITTMEETFSIVLSDGQLMCATTDEPHAGERLGELLVSRGILDEARLQAALDQQSLQHRPLGEVLLQSEFVQRDQLIEALGVQVMRVLERLYACEDATFEMFEGLSAQRAGMRLGVAWILSTLHRAA